MPVIKIKKGLDIPIVGAPKQTLPAGSARPEIQHVALLGDDYPDLKPTMEVQEGERVKLGQVLFTDKKSPGIKFTSPGCGQITEIRRGPKRKFEAIIIGLDGNEEINFQGLNNRQASDLTPAAIRSTLLDSGLWTALRARPYGKIPAAKSEVTAILITAMDTLPLAADPELIIAKYKDDFILGTKILERLTPETTICLAQGKSNPVRDLLSIHSQEFSGPHPAGLPSTHIHFLQPIQCGKSVWHIDYPDVIAIGHLFRTGCLATKRIISMAGPAIKNPRLLEVRLGADIADICRAEILPPKTRLISGSVLDGRQTSKSGFLGRYHRQICALQDDPGRSFLNWLRPGSERFSIKKLFISGFLAGKKIAMSTAAWGGHRAIFPLGTYERVMPLDIMATDLLKALANQDTEKAKELGCLELVEEDLALCSFVCPGKNNFGPMLREILQKIEKDG
jgi:Na+-transporting NADH:ubiquinone oxidoreductase subunit A